MDKNKYNCNHEKSGNGFLLGLIVGVVTTLLFTTSKGRRILKELSENGFGVIEDHLRDLGDIDENFKDDVVISSSPVVKQSHTEGVRSSARRFFRGARRKS